jgi:uncharacterized protein
LLFEWDETKDSANLQKHGLSFSSIISIFRDANIVTIYDDEHSDPNEDRWVSLGRNDKGLVCLVCHTDRSIDGQPAIRIISARRADKNEEIQYYSLGER